MIDNPNLYLPKQKDENETMYGYFVDVEGNYSYGYDFKDNYNILTLSNFVVIPIREVVKDGDLNEIERYFEFEGVLSNGEKLPKITVKAKDFTSLSWVNELWGLKVNIGAGRSIKDRLRHGIQSTNTNLPTHYIYTHTGWRNVITKDGEEVRTFLMNGADVLKNNIEIELEESITDFYEFVDDEISLVEALKYSFQLINESAPLKITIPLAGITFLAPLTPIMSKTSIGKPSTVVWFHGRSRSRKSVLASFFGNHYSTKWDRKHFPSGFDDTYYSIEKKLYYAKDVLMVVDDYYPARKRSEQERMDILAQKLIRSVGNQKGKGRLNNKLESRKEFMPRCTCLVTAEQLPNAGESDLLRLFTVNIEHGQANIPLLEQLTEHRNELNVVGREYVKWLSNNYERIEDDLLSIVEPIKKSFKQKYSLKSGIEECTHLFIGIYTFGKFANEIGFLSDKDFNELQINSMSVLSESAKEQYENEVNFVDPVNMFLEAVEQLLGSKQIVLAPLTSTTYHVGNAKQVGYYDDDYYYFFPKIIYQEVNRFYKNEEIVFPLKDRALFKALATSNKIKQYQGRNTINLHKLKGRYLALKKEEIFTDWEHLAEKQKKIVSILEKKQ